MRAALSLALELFATALAPPRCAACDTRVPMLVVFCEACASTVQRAPAQSPGPGGTMSAFVYGGALARAVTRLKYERRPDLARPLGDLLWRALEPDAAALSRVVVVPVPLHPTRLAERGFNQSALIASRLARRLGASFRPMALARLRDTPRQAALDRQSRLANLSGAFVARQPDKVRARDVLLVDDVRTTGATIEACTEALYVAGARSVSSAAVAAV